ncbi:MAG: flagellar biosynthesis anti-sigma factor FlgM [Syntrophales bacterium]|nr:flagellar biosynthesis anti-sigma factor FlgM [Syntrophales bacterium]MDD5642507.1 flagellar biosynthesis anti-sigma factor FlgM [Syntrophales bacterium]
MKITDIHGTEVRQLQNNEQTNAVETRAQKTEATQNADNIQLSQRARLMQKASKVIAETPDVRQERIDPLKEAVDQGSYPVDPQKVANSMIANMLMER